jgi:hypothetical protein
MGVTMCLKGLRSAYVGIDRVAFVENTAVRQFSKRHVVYVWYGLGIMVFQGNRVLCIYRGSPFFFPGFLRLCHSACASSS